MLLAVNETYASVGYLFVNSEINPNVFFNTRLRSLHLCLDHQIVPFLEHDSWLDCSTIYELPLDDIIKVVSKDPTCHLGFLPQSYFEASIQLLRNAPTIPRKLIIKYFGS